MTDRTVPTEPTPEIVQAIADALEKAEFGWSIRLSKLIDGVETWELRYNDTDETLEFAERDDASIHLARRKKEAQAAAVYRAILTALRPAPGAEVEPVAWQRRILFKSGPSEWNEGRAMTGQPYPEEERPLFAVPPTTDAIRAQARREALGKALHLANLIIGRQEPQDSRAVSDEFVALASVECDLMSPEVERVLDDAIARYEALPPPDAEDGSVIVTIGTTSLAGKPGEAEGWRSLDDCPSDGSLIWLASFFDGSRRWKVEERGADGEHWRRGSTRRMWMPRQRKPAPPADGGGDGE